MVPMVLLFVSGYVAMVASPATASEQVAAVGEASATAAERPQGAPVEAPGVVPDGRPWWERATARPTYLWRTLLAIGAAGIVLLGVAPMALAATNPVADPILNQAIDGIPGTANGPAPAFQLVDQSGAVVSLSGLHGKAVALTFLDPVCTSDCPVIAQEFRDADEMLGSESHRVEFVAIVANPLYNSIADTTAFDRQEGLSSVPNWLYLTGSRSRLEHTWAKYGIQAVVPPAGSMVAHTVEAYIISPSGSLRYGLNADPGPDTAPSESSFAGVVASELRSVLAR
jgi:cytochrome oxidase Cu insertion factor (SCO1/SenC/PrrC family)